VIGAGSVVANDILDNSVAAGIPALVICTTKEYAEKCMRNTLDYNIAEYKSDKCKEVLRVLIYRII
jgi:serine acetyltransferase